MKKKNYHFAVLSLCVTVGFFSCISNEVSMSDNMENDKEKEITESINLYADMRSILSKTDINRETIDKLRLELLSLKKERSKSYSSTSFNAIALMKEFYLKNNIIYEDEGGRLDFLYYNMELMEDFACDKFSPHFNSYIPDLQRILNISVQNREEAINGLIKKMHSDKNLSDAERTSLIMLLSIKMEHPENSIDGVKLRSSFSCKVRRYAKLTEIVFELLLDLATDSWDEAIEIADRKS